MSKDIYKPNGCSNCPIDKSCDGCAKANLEEAIVNMEDCVKIPMECMRGELFNFIETLGMDEKREKAIKDMMREITGRAWTHLTDDISIQQELALVSMNELGMKTAPWPVEVDVSSIN